MKKYLLGTVALVALAVATPAAAADMGARYPDEGAADGCPGVELDRLLCRHQRRLRLGTQPLGPAAGRPQRRHAHTDGGTVGGQIGYNWQFGGWVVGLEAQGNWADFRART